MRPSPLLHSILTGLALYGCGERTEGEMCLAVEDTATSCPPAGEVDLAAMYSHDECDVEAAAVLGEGVLSAADTGGITGAECCYPVTVLDRTPNSECMIGRPFVQAGSSLRSPLVAGTGWGKAGAVTVHDALATAWADQALLEHAAVAAFARLTLELMAHGAPAELVRDVQSAAEDEVLHAQASFRLAGRFAGRDVAPGPFPVGEVTLSPDLAHLAAATLREGCFGETLGALLAAEAVSLATDPVTHEVLRRIAADEARHATLSWRIAAWALREGGEAVRAALVAACAERVLVHPAVLSDEPELTAFGALGPARTRRVVDAGWRSTIAPALDTLLARPGRNTSPAPAALWSSRISSSSSLPATARRSRSTSGAPEV